MKKKIIIALSFCTLPLIAVTGSISQAQQTEVGEIGGDTIKYPSTGKQYWYNGWNICCDKSSANTPCRQSTSSCP